MVRCMPFIHVVPRVFGNKTDSYSDNVNPMLHDYVLICILAVFVTSTNLALINGLKKTNKKLSMSQKLYVYLSMTDSMFGIICLPYNAIMYFLSITNCTTQAIGMTMAMYVFSTGIGTFFCITVMRNIAIRKPLHNVENRNVYIALAAWHL